MVKLFTAIISLLSGVLTLFRDRKLRQQGREEAIREANDELQRQVDLAESVVIAVDFDHDKRMRARFDAASGGR